MSIKIPVGRSLRANTRACVVGCPVEEEMHLACGDMVKIPINNQYAIYGLVHDIHIDDDGLVRQLVTTRYITDAVIEDNRFNRNVPLEISVLFIGYEREGLISHLLPPQPPLSLDSMFACTLEEAQRFTTLPKMGYLRHLVYNNDFPITDVVVAHLQQTAQAQKQAGQPEWAHNAAQEIITLLRDNYDLLNQILSALSDSGLFEEENTRA